jgi:hypothetical protein
MKRKYWTESDLILCQTADGFSLHAPWATDEQIATGDEPYLICGEGTPTSLDYKKAMNVLSARDKRK